jgi:N-acetylglutamate synthase-like GNAT family acetyltransferase
MKEAIMTKKEKTKTYGRKMLKDLCAVANEKGIKVAFHINQDAKYVITRGRKSYNPPTAAAACHYVQGMIDVVDIKS